MINPQDLKRFLSSLIHITLIFVRIYVIVDVMLNKC